MRLIIVSNRLPITIDRSNKSGFKRSIGGLVTGILSYINKIKSGVSEFEDYLWIGWAGKSIIESEQEAIKREYKENYKYVPIFLDEKVQKGFYEEYCNKVIWPLFHYFQDFADYKKSSWDCYKQANVIFYNTIKEQIKKDDFIWIHDYHLMLLPQMIRNDFPNVKISFFLHIPFPSYDIFRLLPLENQQAILNGLLGADVIGVHTIDYAQEFQKTISKVLNFKAVQNIINLGDRFSKIDIFPMGIDYKAIKEISISEACSQKKKITKERLKNYKIILSVDRLDYTKGIINRLEAYYNLLLEYPEWIEKVILKLVIAPSRREIDSYKKVKRAIDECVGKINGRFSSDNWIPVEYQYSQLNLVELCALYGISDVGLVTPLRDGMNLMAKEFIAANSPDQGVLILSETAGAVNELFDAISINPFSVDEITSAIHKALTMSKKEIQLRNERMHLRLSSYDVSSWANEIIQTTQEVNSSKVSLLKIGIKDDKKKNMLQHYKEAKSSVFFLDYDGTLSPIDRNRIEAEPTQAILDTIEMFSSREDTDVVIISGRDKLTLWKWFAHLNVDFGADLGAWISEKSDWKLLGDFNTDWKKQVAQTVSRYVDKLPNSLIEIKTFSIVWDYRMACSELRELRITELITELKNNDKITDKVDFITGENTFTVQSKGTGKGNAATYWLSKKKYDFILAAGDDDSDEELFESIPKYGYSIKVGKGKTVANHRLKDHDAIIKLLDALGHCKSQSKLV
ncbi:MAG: bifunctional alpha,alpha-trehalose-phosphate synthase (UDP-forming)/trehalose-phosphatase [Flavobacterium nitrogenifigens]|uniref:Trehalose 6-phosphate synthase/phosphatase n=1 Tax=Flavobacterium nitrogenifigens TaxID=1617283 RepID=A0A521F9L3_9FLAO|nr:bifunctional alpha,alpha-trehalose-phosphate synthase (UDP-forming)/trehalose-phosphatase [Flavobacterium nitrogenifigens]KAF2338015.1 bifunctional alpha,alpha-trehalose-phosphate synthase (UDP-forming)/trehalose-phosphatase [Flavobacterium nitrogenifigens]MDQ8014083.1 bifunctional alpha,alpha-trehalose-phosphate synthase (UDP-forming)/trehalose-phosphatase [Flavobacterium nitrogenifigens]SMO92899.1 trehalose 6-phosphate synthase/phosphatase [Flavobacterium nitrogenifigens]